MITMRCTALLLSAVAAAALAFSASATAANIYVLTGSSSTSASPSVPTNFGMIDTTTGVYTQIQADINAGNTLWGLAYNSTLSAFYAISNEGGFGGGGLRTLDTSGTLSAAVGSGFSNYSMVYNSVDSAIYGYNYNTDQWYSMNPSTGVSTARGTGPGVASEPTGGRGALLNGTYYTSFNTSFGTVDTSGSNFSYSTLATDSKYAFMNLATDGTTLYGIYGDGTDRDLYTIDPTDGTLTFLRSITALSDGYFYGAGMIPNPSAVPGTGLAGLVTIGLAGCSRRRRR